MSHPVNEANGRAPTWSREDERLLQLGWAMGLSVTALASLLGRTRSMVAGKIHRERRKTPEWGWPRDDERRAA
jgi:hypothetical protein